MLFNTAEFLKNHKNIVQSLVFLFLPIDKAEQFCIIKLVWMASWKFNGAWYITPNAYLSDVISFYSHVKNNDMDIRIRYFCFTIRL